MSLPRQVEAQGKRAEELQAARNRGNTEQPAPAPSPTPGTVAPLEAPKGQAAPVATPPAAVAAPTPPVDPDADHRLKVLQGKYNAEVPRLAAQAKAEKEAREKAEAELADLRKKNAAQPLVTPEEVKEFGEPLVDMARRLAREENRALVNANEKLQAQVDELSTRVGQTAQVGQNLNTQAFYSALAAKHADWQSVNAEPEFLKWLDEVDPLYGRPRQTILDEAQNALDAERVAAFFTRWKSDVQTRAASRTDALEAQVTPSTGSTTGAPVAPAKQIWTPALIAKFYDDVRRNRIKTADAERIELDIQAAPREGRYRPR